MPSATLTNAARAFAHVALADGQLSPKEADRFARVVAAEPGLAGSSPQDVTIAWEAAVAEISAASSFGGTLVAIRSEVSATWDKAMLMRIAQAAVVADDRFEPQESVAVRTLAEALGLDPETY
jgi:tellurite resistance protein